MLYSHLLAITSLRILRPWVDEVYYGGYKQGGCKEPLSLNLYTYCVGNPIKLVDIDGHVGRDTQSLINLDGSIITGGGGEVALVVFNWLIKEGETIANAFKIAYGMTTIYSPAVLESININTDTPNIKFIEDIGSGTHYLRYFDVAGTRVRINSGHGYDRDHRTSKTMQSIGTRNEIEGAMLTEVYNLIKSGYDFETKNTTTMHITINGRKFAYNIIQFKDGSLCISTYYEE